MKAELDRNVAIALLIDFYGAFLTEKQRSFMDLHFEQDLSLAEIAEQEGISRQGVHDALKRGEKALYEIEAKMGILRRYLRWKEYLEKAREELDAGHDAAKELIDQALACWEEE